MSTPDSTRERPPLDEGARGLVPMALSALVARVARHPAPTLWMVALVTLFALGISLRFLSFRTDRADLISPTEEFHQRWLDYINEFGDQSEIVVVVEGPHESVVRALMDDLGTRIEQESELFDHVFYRFDPSGLRSKALQFLDPEALESGLEQLSAYRPILAGHWDRAGLESYSRQLAMMVSNDSAANEAVDAVDGSAPVATALSQARALSESLHSFITESGRFVAPWPSLMPAGQSLESSFEPQYQITASGRMGFILVSPIDRNNDFSGGSRSIARLREVAAETVARYEGAAVGLTGVPILEADEMERSQADMAAATLISFAGVALLLVFGFRGWRHPLVAMLMLAVGVIWALGWATLVVGHLNILSVSFAAILVGLGIDYAIHFLSRYIELRRNGVELINALAQTASSVGTGIVTAAVTTALAFSCAAVTSFQGVAELGIIAAGGVFLCAITSFVVLPALVAISDRGRTAVGMPIPFQGNWIRRLIAARPGRLLAASSLIAVALACCAVSLTDDGITTRVTYDSNLLNLQADDIESVQLLNRIFEETQGSLLYAVSITDDPLRARLMAQEYRELPTVGRVEELASYLPAYPSPETRLLIQGFHSQLEHLSDLPREFPGLDPLSIGRGLEELYLALNDRTEVDAVAAAHMLDEFLNELERVPVGAQVELLSRYQYGMLNSLRGQLTAIADLADDEPVSPDDFAEPVRSRFVSDQGRWLVRVYPREQVWDAAPLEAFVNDVRSIDPNVTGTPLQNYEAARAIRESYTHAAVYALVVITLVLLADVLSTRTIILSLTLPILVLVFALVMSGVQPQMSIDSMLIVYTTLAVAVAGVLEPKGIAGTLVALMPPVVGSAVMFGILGVLGQDLNPANMIVLPLILGIGVDNGVHAFHDFRRQQRGYQMSSSVFNAIMLNSLTSMIGFGSMLVADHRGLASLGLVLTIGVGSCLLVSLVPLPALLTFVSKQRRPEVSLEGVESPQAGNQTMVSPLRLAADSTGEPTSQFGAGEGMQLPKAG